MKNKKQELWFRNVLLWGFNFEEYNGLLPDELEAELVDSTQPWQNARVYLVHGRILATLAAKARRRSAPYFDAGFILYNPNHEAVPASLEQDIIVEIADLQELPEALERVGKNYVNAELTEVELSQPLSPSDDALIAQIRGQVEPSFITNLRENPPLWDYALMVLRGIA